MHVVNWLVAAIVATMAQLFFEVTAQNMRLTRMSLPYLLGTMYTDQRSKAKLLGFANHLGNGLLFAMGYILVFHAYGRCSWWFGGMLGLTQAAFFLVVIVPLIPYFHPRMASERQGPTVNPQLEPPGFLALNYGPRTPLAIVLSHMLFGIVLGALYKL